MKQDFPIKGLGLMLVAVIFIAVMGMFSKLAAPYHDPVMIVFYRNLVGLVIVSGIILALRRPELFTTQRLKAQAIRAVGGSLGVTLVFWAYVLLPMAEVTAIGLTGGIMTTALSGPVLGEKVGPYRWGAVLIGFVGAYLIVSPDHTDLPLDGVLVAFAATFTGEALIGIMLRSLGRTEHSLTTVFYFMLIGSVLFLPYMIYQGEASLPTAESYPFLLACGIIGVTQLVIKSQAYVYAEASLLSPVHYTLVIWGTFLGWFMFGDWPTDNVFYGASVVIASNMMILWRESLKAQKHTEAT